MGGVVSDLAIPRSNPLTPRMRDHLSEEKEEGQSLGGSCIKCHIETLSDGGESFIHPEGRIVTILSHLYPDHGLKAPQNMWPVLSEADGRPGGLRVGLPENSKHHRPATEPGFSLDCALLCLAAEGRRPTRGLCLQL